MLKRNNWTNKEIIEILRSRLSVSKTANALNGMIGGCNLCLEGLIDDFEACDYPTEIMGAFAYDTEKQDFIHIGQMPEEDKIHVPRNIRRQKIIDESA